MIQHIHNIHSFKLWFNTIILSNWNESTHSQYIFFQNIYQHLHHIHFFKVFINTFMPWINVGFINSLKSSINIATVWSTSIGMITMIQVFIMTLFSYGAMLNRNFAKTHLCDLVYTKQFLDFNVPSTTLGYLRMNPTLHSRP